jgi:uncharacterized protein (DUF983 family)
MRYSMSPMTRTVTTLFVRALTLRCPRCGRTKLFRRGLTMYERCSYCGWVFEREEGYWTGAMAVNLVVAELIVAAVVIPLAAIQVPLAPLLGFGVPVAALLPVIFYRHAKAFWMMFDFLINPVALQ